MLILINERLWCGIAGILYCEKKLCRNNVFVCLLQIFFLVQYNNICSVFFKHTNGRSDDYIYLLFFVQIFLNAVLIYSTAGQLCISILFI